MQFHVVDDEGHLADIVVSMLKIMGFSGRAFTSPYQYLEYVNSSDYMKPLAILTDIVMPGMTGYEMIKAVKQIHPDQRFITISGTPYVKKEDDIGAFASLAKPVNMDVLEETINALVRNQ